MKASVRSALVALTQPSRTPKVIPISKKSSSMLGEGGSNAASSADKELDSKSVSQLVSESASDAKDQVKMVIGACRIRKEWRALNKALSSANDQYEALEILHDLLNTPKFATVKEFTNGEGVKELKWMVPKTHSASFYFSDEESVGDYSVPGCLIAAFNQTLAYLIEGTHSSKGLRGPVVYSTPTSSPDLVYPRAIVMSLDSIETHGVGEGKMKYVNALRIEAVHATYHTLQGSKKYS